jgi:hypothetical protein
MADLYALGLAMFVASTGPLSAQQLAPGPALPPNTGGIGPGSTRIAPGPAGGPLIQQQGPGGVPLAIGPPLGSQPNLHRTHRVSHARHNASPPTVTRLRHLR